MPPKLSITEEPLLKGAFVDWIGNNYLIFSRGNKIYKCDFDVKKIQKIGHVPQTIFKRIITSNRFGRRLLRQTVYNIIPLLDDLYFISFGNEIGYLQNGVYTRIKGTEKAGRILRQGACLANNKKVYWGSYLPNKERNSQIRIYEFNPEDKSLNIVYTFELGDIRHVHRVSSSDGNLWVTTGDKPQECKILKSEDFFEHLNVAFEGDETWRAVGLQFDGEDIYYASDCEFIDNYIYKINTLTGHREALYRINAPCYYSTKIGEDILFATTAELCPSQKDINANIYHLEIKTEKIYKVFSAEKDLISSRKKHDRTPLVSKLFQNGIINFPGGNQQSLGFTYFSCQGLKSYDFKVFKISV